MSYSNTSLDVILTRQTDCTPALTLASPSQRSSMGRHTPNLTILAVLLEGVKVSRALRSFLTTSMALLQEHQVWTSMT